MTTPKAAFAWALLALCCALGGCSDPAPPQPAPTSAEAQALLARAQQLVQEGYAHKRDGGNGAALARFEEACALIEKAVGAETVDYASCLDDQASVHLRLGHADRAAQLFDEAQSITARHPGANRQLALGLRVRQELVRRLRQRGITCAEPATPPPDAPLPYFPVVEEMQDALGRLTPQLADCHVGAPKLVTMRVVITGDGRPVLAESRGPEAGTPLGACIAERLMRVIPEADLPRFRACFRGFVYPFTVGGESTVSALPKPDTAP
jgi:hypothetical protein